MNIRIAKDEDVGLLAELNAQMIEDEGHQNKMTVKELEGRMQNWLENTYEAAIIEDQDEVVAYALYRQSDDGWEGDAGGIYLRHFFVVRDRRREGIGRNAFELLRTNIWKPGCRISLEVLMPNKQAQTFWESLGFKEYSISYELHEP